MNIKELFYKPLDRAINGVVKADQNDNTTVYQELDEYVVTNELEKHFRDFFQSYGTDLSDPSIANRVGVWISGFFGWHCCKQGSESMIFPSKKLRDRKLYLLAKLLLEYYRYKIMKLVLCVEHA